MEKKNKLITIFKNLDVIIAGASLVVLVFTTFLDVIMRYVFLKPFVWEEEVQLWCFLWMIFFGAGAAFRAGSHVAIEFIVDAMPPKVKKVFEILDWVMVVFIIGYFGIQSGSLIKQYIASQEVTSVLNIPYTVIYLAVPIGCVLMIVNYTITMVHQVFFADESKKEEGDK